MIEKWLLIGTDERFQYVKHLFEEDGINCQRYVGDHVTSELIALIQKEQPKHIVFPVTGFTGELTIPHRVTVYLGKQSRNQMLHLQHENSQIYHYLQDEPFIWENAALTAEAFLQVFYQQTAQSITSRPIYIAGFGRLGKMLAFRLGALKAQVVIISSIDKELAEAEALGYSAKKLADSDDFSNHYVINTIPNKWYCETFTPPLHLFDLASSPGCLTTSRQVEYYTILPGLPGKYFPEAAAKCLYKVLIRIRG